jgi:two-component system chemotaxis response regulator CheV
MAWFRAMPARMVRFRDIRGRCQPETGHCRADSAHAFLPEGDRIMTEPHQKILTESGTNEVEVLEFDIGGQPFGVNVAKVSAIVQVDPATVTRVPNAHDGMVGMMIYRDHSIPLVDLAVMLDRPPRTEEPESWLVVASEFNGMQLGFRVDGVNRIHRVSWSDFVPINSILAQGSASITGSVNIEKKDVLIVDMESITARIFPEQSMDRPGAFADSEERATARGDVRIVLAEDSSVIRGTMLKVLREAGYDTIESFDNGESAWEYLREAAGADSDAGVDLLISDIEMPRMDGLTLCKRFKTELGMQSTPVIMFSSLINEQMAAQCDSVGADAHINKPQIQELVQLIDRFCLAGEPVGA